MAVALRTPLILVTDADLVRVSGENPGYSFERDEDGTIIVRPTSTNDGARSGEAFGQLREYAKRAGGKAFDSNAGFAIGPGQRVYAPDASWVIQARIDALTAAERSRFWPMSPDVAIEVKSETDDFRDTVAKIGRFIERGSSYAAAIDPAKREVVHLGKLPRGLLLDFDLIIDA